MIKWKEERTKWWITEWWYDKMKGRKAKMNDDVNKRKVRINERKDKLLNDDMIKGKEG